MTGKTFVYDETYPVEIVRDGIKITVPFHDIKKDDRFYVPIDIGHKPYLVKVAESAHFSGDADYEGYLFYDEYGSDWYPEDFGAPLKIDK